ncbi:hypothetical protein [Curtobacterium sp. PhB115]|uniref:hypothetical protein n=1 Tax=Curtobacterium sp. PhB115 TaxID=2485173 RepID=UPI000F4CF40F|nr:hypothetical protein [Curtobacterium sp. PhB115]ROP74283.1 hypothetical protein EDF19_0364 [Curtobacterium sp. PhB115]
MTNDDETTRPTHETAWPTHEAARPTDETTRPTHETARPTDETTAPYPAGPVTDEVVAVPLKAVPAGRGPARFGTIFWGVLLLVFAVAMGVSALPMVEVDPTTLLLAGCIAAGVLLVAAGLVAAFTRPQR